MKVLIIILSLFIAYSVNAQPCDHGDNTPPCPYKLGCLRPNCDCPETGIKDSMPVIFPHDPNLIIGPAGYDTVSKWMSVNDIYPYRVLFENDPDSATAPVRKAIIYVPLHQNVNPYSLRLGDFGFGSFIFSVPANTSVYSNRLDLRDSLGIFVDVTAGLDIGNRRAFWVFESIDPATGLSSTLPPNFGFLPVNDTTRRNGEGFVTFTVQPVSTAHTHDTLTAKAAIVFDDNDPIETNIEENTIDAVAPQSQFTMATVSQDTIHLFWSGSDDPNGSGVKDYALYVSTNNGPFVLYKNRVDGLDDIYLSVPGNSYCFFTRARDNTGNQERLKDSCVLRIGGGVVPLTWLYFNGKKDNEIIKLNWATGQEQNTDKFWIQRSGDGNNFTDIGYRKAASNSSITQTYHYDDSTGVALPSPLLYYRIRQVDLDGRFTYSNIVVINNAKKVSGLLVQVYPNPFTHQLNIKIQSQAVSVSPDRAELYNNSGSLIYKRSLVIRPGNYVVNISDLPVLPAGIYYLRVYVNGEKETVKIVKQ